MKVIRLILLCLLWVSLFGCAKNTDTADDIMSRLEAANIMLPDAYIYINDYDPASEHYLSNEELGYLYYGTEETPEELDAIDSYCIRISKGININELHIIKVRHRSDADMIERMLNRRARLLTESRINPNNSSFLCEGAEECKVFSKGNFVFLIAGDDISPIVKAIEERL